ncbi:MAG: hypothetical protein U0840_19215 [Gemmataceae bacterium]
MAFGFWRGRDIRRSQASQSGSFKRRGKGVRLEALEDRLAPAHNLTVGGFGVLDSGIDVQFDSGTNTTTITAIADNATVSNATFTLHLLSRVIFTSAATGTQAGNITINSNLDTSSSSNFNLTFQTDPSATEGDILVNEMLKVPNGSLLLTLKAKGDIQFNKEINVRPTGSLSLTAGGSITQTNGRLSGGSIQLAAGTGIGSSSHALDTGVSNLEAETATGGIFVANTGALTIGGVTGALPGVQVITSGSIVISSDAALSVNVAGDSVAGPGDITLTASGLLSVVQNVTSTATADGATISLTGNGGVAIYNSVTVTNSNGKAVTIDVDGFGSASQTVGIVVDSSTLNAQGGAVSLEGTGVAGGFFGAGVFLHNGAVVEATGAGTVTVLGTGGNGTQQNFGVWVLNATIRTADGDLTVQGTGNGSADANYGVVTTSALLEATGTGKISITGTGADGTSFNDGVVLQGATTQVLTAGGDLSITGTGKGTFSGGITFDNPATISAGSFGLVTLKGTGTLPTIGLWFFSGGNITGQTIDIDAGGIAQSSGSINATNLRVKGTGTFTLLGTNDVGTVAADVNGSFSLANSTGLTVGTVLGTAGITTSDDDVTLCAGTGNLTIANDIQAGTATVRLQADAASSGVVSTTGTITAGALGVRAGTGGIDLQAGSNAVGTLAVTTTGALLFDNTTSLLFGTVTAKDCFTPTVVGLTAGGDVALSIDTGDMTLATPIEAAGFTVSLTALAGAILDGNGAANNITAQSLALKASTGIGSPTDALDIEVTNLAASNSTSGGVAITDPDGFNVTTVGAVAGVTANGQAVSLSATLGTGTITVSQAISATGAGGSVTVVTARDMIVNANITGGANGLTLSANQQATPTVEDFAGVTVQSGAIVTTTDNGAVTVSGTGGSAPGSFNHGVIVIGTNSAITSGGGNVSVTGKGGGDAGLFNINMGVSVANGGQITAGGSGSVTVHGTGGAGSGSNNYGVLVTTAGKITTEGSGSVTVHGTGGAGSDKENHGVMVMETNSAITSGGGNVSVTGQGGGDAGSKTNNYGVFIQLAGQITAGGSGSVTVHGTGGASTGGFNTGVLVSDTNSAITSSGGNVSVTGQGRQLGDFNLGVFVGSSGQITAGGSGSVTVHGTGGSGSGNSQRGVLILGANAAITSSGGNVSVTGQGGGSSGSGSYNYGVTVTMAGQITAGGSGSVTVNGTGGASTGSTNLGVLVTGANAAITSGGGDVSVTGQGGGVAGSQNTNNGVTVASAGQITAGGSGSVTVNGTGGASAGDFNTGVLVSDTNSAITSSGGNVSVTGQGGSGSGSTAVTTETNGRISSGNNAAISVTGDSMNLSSTNSINAGTGLVTLQPKTAGTAIDLGGADGPGILGLTDAELGHITAGTLVIGDSTSGNITVSAVLTAPAGYSMLSLITGGSISDTNNGRVSIANLALQASTGIGSTGNPLGTQVSNLEAETATGGIFVANTGNLTIGGVTVDLQGLIVSTSGNVEVSSTGDLTISEQVDGPEDITLTSAGTLGLLSDLTSGSGDISLTANEMDYASGSSISGTGNLFLAPQTNSRDISLGAASNQPGKLSLTATDLAAIGTTFFQVMIGSPLATGLISVDGNATLTTSVLLLQNTGSGAGGLSVNATLNVGTGNLVVVTEGGITSTASGLLQATNLTLEAESGIGTSTDPLFTQVSNLQAETNTGGIYIENTGALVIGETSTFMDGLQTASGGDIQVSASSSLTLWANVLSSGGDITLTAEDSAGTGDDLTVKPAILISANGGNILLQAGDDLTIDSSATVETTGGGTIVIEIDAGNADTGVGGVANFSGVSLKAPGGATVRGQGDADTFNLSPSANTPIMVEGNAPLTIPGDTVNLDVQELPTGTLDITDRFFAELSWTGAAGVKLDSIEEVNPLNGQMNVVLDLAVAKLDGQPIEDGSSSADGVTLMLNPALTDLLFLVGKNGAPATDYFSIGKNGVATTQVLGSNDPEWVVVRNTVGPTAILTEGGNDSIVVAPLAGGLRSGLVGPLQIDAGAGANRLTVNDSSNTQASTVELKVSTIAGTGYSIGYAATGGSFQQVSYQGGSGADSVTYFNRNAGSMGVNTGAGNDRIFVRLTPTNLLNGLTVNGGAGRNTLTPQDLSQTALVKNVPTGPGQGRILTTFFNQPTRQFVYQNIAQVVGINAQANYIRSLYIYILGRVATPQEVTYWRGVLATQGRLAVVRALELSPAGRTNLVRQWFLLFKGRSPVGSEGTPLVQALLAGQSEETVLGRLLGNARAPWQSGTRTTLVNYYYRRLLGRAPTATERTQAVNSSNGISQIRMLIEVSNAFFNRAQ